MNAEYSNDDTYLGESFVRVIAYLEEQLKEVSQDRDKYRDELAALKGTQSDSIDTRLYRLNEKIQRSNRRLRNLPGELLTDVQALNQLVSRFDPIATLPIVSGWALSPSSLLKLTDIIQSNSVEIVLECGSGTSTLWMAYALRARGTGKVIALDHKAEYAERTRQLVKAHGLDPFVDVLDAPLVEVSTSRGNSRWYDLELESIKQRIDLLVVDGPPGDTAQHARYPALPLTVSKLAPSATVVLDDMDRRDERETVEFWLEEHPSLTRKDTPNSEIAVLSFDSGARSNN